MSPNSTSFLFLPDGMCDRDVTILLSVDMAVLLRASYATFLGLLGNTIHFGVLICIYLGSPFPHVLHL